MKPHCMKILTEAKSRISQLFCAVNSCFGSTQLSLRNMYIAYIQIIFGYDAPAWFPFMSKTNVNKLQTLQNKALLTILGVPRSIRIHDIHLEAIVPPLVARYEAATAYQSEKYQRHAPTDTLYQLLQNISPT